MMTLRELFAYWLVNYAAVHTKSAHTFNRHFVLYLFDLADVPIDQIRKVDVVALQARLKSVRNESAANKAVELLSMLYNKAAEWEVYEGKNPAAKVRKFKRYSRKRFLQPEEMKRFLDAVEACSNRRVRDFLKMLLWTGQRRGNVADMRWKDIDLDRQVWNIPYTKNGEPHAVPLVNEAMAVLESRKGDNREFVFPVCDGSKGMYHLEYRWREIRNASGLHDLTLHDLRRTHASWQVITGASLPIVGKTLNHKSASSTEVYARLNLAPVRYAMETAVNAMLEL